MCAALLHILTVTSNKFWPLYNTHHRRFSNGHLYPSPDFTARNWGDMMQHVAQSHPTRSLAVRRLLSKRVSLPATSSPHLRLCWDIPYTWILRPHGGVNQNKHWSHSCRSKMHLPAPPTSFSAAPFPPFPFSTFNLEHW